MLTAGITAGITALPALAALSPQQIQPTQRILKALKFGMIAGNASILEKFTLAKSCGFDGVEMDSPSNWNLQEVLDAKEATGLQIPGVVLSSHWSKPFNHPEEQVRKEASKSLDQAIKDCNALGGTSVLVVPAVVNASMGYEEAYELSQIEIGRHVPTAESLDISIAFENVWNNFLLSPIEASRYVDEFDSDHVGWYFDIGNLVNFGYPDQWIRTLGHRIKKLDVKDFSRQKRNDEGLWKGFSVKIGDGDSDWDSVCEAIKDIKYSGWATAEVGGGDRERLTEIASRMDTVFKPLNG
ncbi:MAG: sugar phosphate isomerase/epimerase [Phycisphaerales bacterium]|nr:sugar phosphate isomerase/epimerase [Phycisphaerales bacterium]